MTRTNTFFSSRFRVIALVGTLVPWTWVAAQTTAGTDARPGFEVYLCSHSHTDYAWFDAMSRCLDETVAGVAKAVELAQQYPDYRFTSETALALREFLARNPEKYATVQKLMREGRLAVGGFYTGPWELSLGPEGLVRELYYGKRWFQTHLGVDVPVVWQPDVAGHTAQLPQILRKAGIRGFVISAGANETGGPALFNWQSRDGSGVPTWSSYYGSGDALGWREPNLDQASKKTPPYIEGIIKNATRFGLPMFGFLAEGMDLAMPTENVLLNIRKWNRKKLYPPVRYATTTEVFDAVARESSRQALPAFAGEMPSLWDTVQSQGNECFMNDRRLDGRVLSAEKFSALAAVLSPGVQVSTRFGGGFTTESGFYYPQEDFDHVWENRLLVYDHNWGGSHGAENAKIRAGKVREAAAITDTALNRAFQTISGHIRFNPAQKRRVVVFNPLSWDRSDVVTATVPIPREDAATVALVDSQGRRVPHQVLRADAETVEVAFRAEVPSLGYATYYLVDGTRAPGAASGAAVHIDARTNTFENGLYRLQLDAATGSIRSIYDKREKRELVGRHGRYGFSELVALEDTAEDINVHLTGKQWLMREHPSTIRVVEQGPVRLVVEVSGGLLERSKRRQQIVLYPEIARIDLMTDIDWEGKENIQLYQAFPLDVPEPVVKYAVPYGWQQFGVEMKFAAPSPSNALATHPFRGVRGWMEFANADTAVTLTSECNFAAFKDLAAGKPEPGYLPQYLLIRTVRSCGDAKLFYRQEGKHSFRFSVQSQADSPRAGAEMESPLLTYVPESANSPSPGSLPDRYSFIQVRPANVHVAVVKRAENGQGVILRLVETEETTQETKAEVRAFRPVRSAKRTSLLEEDESDAILDAGAVRLAMPASAIETLRLTF